MKQKSEKMIYNYDKYFINYVSHIKKKFNYNQKYNNNLTGFDIM